MRINTQKIIMALLTVYPLLNLCVCFAFKGDMMTTFSILCCIIILFVGNKKIKATKITVFIFLIIIFTSILAFVRETNSVGYSSCLAYSLTIIFFVFYAESNIRIETVRKYFIKNVKSFFLMQTLFFLVLLLYVLLNGFSAGWDTYVLQGPYLYPHTLAYLLLFMSMVDFYIWMESRHTGAIIFSGICSICILLTGVRTVLISLVFTILYMFYNLMDLKKFRKLLFCISIGLVVLVVAYKKGAFDIIIHKTLLAISNSTITNGRGNIVKASLLALNIGNSPLNLLCGVGMNSLQNSNMSILGADIHAHNDLVDVLVCYGVVNLILYVLSFLKFSKDNLICFIGSLGVLALLNGLFTYIDCIPILIYVRVLFSPLHKIRR